MNNEADGSFCHKKFTIHTITEYLSSIVCEMSNIICYSNI